ncbi:MAG TPA: DUF6599 family protein [Thermoanaerobaculia bacterium]|nr:DUF6599 family protein [Thermoanaerobaculia bacterium]
MKPRPVHFVLVALLVAVVGLVVAGGRRTRDDREATLAALRTAAGPRLPSALGAGATARDEPVRYAADTLYELIDGAAEGYLADGFESCLAAVYDFAGHEVAAEVHRFASPEGARARLEAERPRAAVAVPELPEGVSDGAVLLARSGRDLLKLTRLDPTRPGGEAALAALALAWQRESPP